MQHCNALLGARGAPPPTRPRPITNQRVEQWKRQPLDTTIAGYVAGLDRAPPGILGARILRVDGASVPRWDGRPVRHLVVVTQANLWQFAAHGEFLQFGRYLVEARRRCERLTVAVDRGIHAFARRLVLADVVCEPAEFRHVVAGADAYAMLDFTLPHALGELHGVPLPIVPLAEHVPALDPARHNFGVRWAAAAGTNSPKTIPTSCLWPLASLGHVHSLQVDDAANFAPRFVRRHALDTWEHTCGLISALDAVVTVDTAVAHLAASMGKSTHLVLGDRFACWRWGNVERTPWYPTMRIYRGDPGRCVQEVARALHNLHEAPACSPLTVVSLASIDARPLRHLRWAPYMSGPDLQALLALLRGASARRVLEIGVQEGSTAAFLLANMPELEGYQGVDVLPGYRFARTNQASEVPRVPGGRVAGDPRFGLVLRARGSFDLTAADLEPCDAVFIDGDHGLEAVRHDTALARSVLRPGGVIVWHDAGNPATPDVLAVLHELRSAGRDVRRVAGSWVAFERC